MIGPEVHEPFGEADLGAGRPLKPRQGVGPQLPLPHRRLGLLGPRAHLCRWSGGGRRSIAGSRRRRSRAVLCSRRFGICRSRHLRRGRLGGAVLARNPHALLLGEGGLQRRLGCRQRRRAQVRDARLHQLGLEEAARIGGGARQIAGVGPAAGPECEAVEGDKASLGIGTNSHRLHLFAVLKYRPTQARATGVRLASTRFGPQWGSGKAARVHERLSLNGFRAAIRCLTVGWSCKEHGRSARRLPAGASAPRDKPRSAPANLYAIRDQRRAV